MTRRHPLAARLRGIRLGGEQPMVSKLTKPRAALPHGTSGDGLPSPYITLPLSAD